MRLVDADALMEANKLLTQWVGMLGIEARRLGIHVTIDGLDYAETLRRLNKTMLAATPTVQREGCKLVPVEPTDEMWQTAFDIYDITYHGGCQMTDEIMRIKAIYQAMLSVAPDKE